MTRSKTQAVLDWLKTGAGITSIEAFKELGVTRLSAVIFNLRKRAYDIESETVEVRDRYGEHCKVARYKLRK